LIEEIVFEEEQKNYRNSFLLEDYSYDKEIYNKLVSTADDLSLEIMREIIRINKEKIVRQTALEKSFIISAKVNSNYYTGSFVSVRGIDNLT